MIDVPEALGARPWRGPTDRRPSGAARSQGRGAAAIEVRGRDRSHAGDDPGGLDRGADCGVVHGGCPNGLLGLVLAVEAAKLELYYHSIHYFDAIRALIGEPVRVFGTQSRRPGQVPRGETRMISTLIYPGDLRAVVHANHENLSGRQPCGVPGRRTSGTIRGTLGLMYDYPHGRPDTLEIWSSVRPPTAGSRPGHHPLDPTRSSARCARCWLQQLPRANRRRALETTSAP